MRGAIILSALTAALVMTLGLRMVLAQETATPATPRTATETPGSVTTTEPPPATLGPATPTPQLPEEGGPSGGVISGHLYLDADGSRSRTSADEPIQGSGVSIEQIDDAGVAIVGEGVDSDANGFWERRALADGRYRVSWEPPIPVELYSQTIPPAETIVVNPNLTIQRVTQFVEIAGANRVADVDFGIPAPTPAAGAVTAPNTGAGDSRSQAPILVLAAAAAIALLGAAALTLRGPRRM